MFIRSGMEYNSAVWHSSFTDKNTSDLERMQKTAAKVILKSGYESYEKALQMLNMENLRKKKRKIMSQLCKKVFKK